MSSGYYPRATQVMQRSIEVQRLVIPFLITSNATPASKVLGTDEASILFLQTQGITQINSTSGALDSGESAPPFDLTATDSTGAFNLLVTVNPAGQDSDADTVVKIMHATITDRTTGAAYPTYHNSTNPDIVQNGSQMLINCASGVNLGTTSLNGCLEIEYTVST
jgi:hypothetical protein